MKRFLFLLLVLLSVMGFLYYNHCINMNEPISDREYSCWGGKQNEHKRRNESNGYSPHE